MLLSSAPARFDRCWRAQTVTPSQDLLFSCLLRQAAREEGDAEELDIWSMEHLLADDELVSDLIQTFSPDIGAFCAANGWPAEAFLVCRCSAACLIALARTPEGESVINAAVSRLREAAERAAAETPADRRRRSRTSPAGGVWLQQFVVAVGIIAHASEAALRRRRSRSRPRCRPVRRAASGCTP